MADKSTKFSTLYRIAVVAAVALIVFLIIILKNQGRDKERIEKTEPVASALAEDTIAGADTLKPAGIVDSLIPVALEPESLPKTAPSGPDKPAGPAGELPAGVLARVNGESITAAQFDSVYSSLPASTRDYYKDDMPGFLEELITRQLLLQEARRRKIQETPEFGSARARNPGREDDVMITVLAQGVINAVTLSGEELRDYFDRNVDQLPDKNYESVKEQLRPMALEEKQQATLENFIGGLRSKATIVRDQKWINQRLARAPDDPLSAALKSGQATVADFGRGTCVPCKMMEPILKKLQQEYHGRASILILDVGEYASLSRRHGIRLIPTQVFFDAAGKEVHRHQGFMPEADIVAQLKKMGVE